MIDKNLTKLLVLLGAAGTLVKVFQPQIADFGIWAATPGYGAATVVASIFVWQFVHLGFFHFLMNAFLLLYFGNPLERTLGKPRFAAFFGYSTAFATVLIMLLESGRAAVGLDAFSMAVLGYVAVRMRENRHPEMGGAVMFLFLFVAFSFLGGYGLAASLSGIAAGVSFRVLERMLTKNVS